MRLTNSASMRDADNAAIQIRGIPSTLLMRNAAGFVARAAEELMGDKRRAVVFCGSGNNGGDGVAAACRLMLRGVSVRVLLVGSRGCLSQDTQEMARRLKELGGALEDFDPDDVRIGAELKSAGVIIDAMFGVGLSRPLQGRALAAVELINASGVPVVSADIASGVEADTGRILGAAVRAARTVTFTLAKPGHFVEPGCVCCGELEICNIGIPADLKERAETDAYAVSGGELSLPKRPEVSHKGDYGKLLIVGGSVGYTGAPNLCARAAVRSGAGLVYLGVPAEIYGICAVKNDEAMPFPLACNGDGQLAQEALGVVLERLESCGVGVIGPGLGRPAALPELIAQVIERAGKPLVLDADALWAVAQDPSMLERATKPLILTPHDGEFARLYASGSGSRIDDAREFAAEHDCVLVLKGHRTICAFPDGEVYINTTGNPGMAKGGSGDVLSGTLGALLGQMPLKQAVITAVWLHGRAGDVCAERLGEYGMTPVDIIETLPETERELAQCRS